MSQTLTPALSISQSLDKSWRSVIAHVWPFIGFTVLYFIASRLISYIPVFNSLVNLFSFIYAVSMYSAFAQIDKFGQLGFNDFFNWTPKFGKLLLAHLMMVLIAVLIFLPVLLLLAGLFGVSLFTVFSDGRFSNGLLPAFSAGMILLLIFCVLVCAILLALFSFALQFIVLFRDMTLMDALKLSFRVGRHNLGSIIVFLLLAFGIVLLGALALLVGLLVAIPIIVGMQYYFLRSIFPDGETGQWDFMQEAQ